MATSIPTLTPNGDDTELVGSRIGRIDPNNFSLRSDATSDDDDSDAKDSSLLGGLFDEDGDPTGRPDQGEPDHHQDDNYALGGHVTRSGSV